MHDLINRATQRFTQLYDRPPAVAATAPGRVELAGNHTDYNGGLVLPCAVDRYTVIVAAPRDDRSCRVFSMNLDDSVAFDVDDLQPDPQHGWGDYLKGVIDQLSRAGVKVAGFDACLVSNVPVAAGMSSSAALEVATAMAVQGLFGFEMDRLDLAKLLQRAENEFVGVACGILDQFSSLFGTDGAVLYLDCRSLEHDVVPFAGPAPALVICDSVTSRSLADGMYNRRRAECEAAVAHFDRVLDRPIASLRDVEWSEFVEHESELDPAPAARARHVLRENQRVLQAREAIIGGDLDALGRILLESHASSRDLFENSSPHLDALVELARAAPGCIGAKLTGGGWAGCTVNLVDPARVDAFVASVAEGYRGRFALTPDVYPCQAAGGARWWECLDG